MARDQEALLAVARKQVLRFAIRQASACLFGLFSVGLSAIALLELVSLRPAVIDIVLAATACFLWWKYMRTMLRAPTGLTCPACGRTTALLAKRQTAVGYEWDFSCSQCGMRVETSLGDGSSFDSCSDLD